MRSLANLLEAAARRAATEVVLESGQPVVFTTARGPEVEQSVLPRTELFDMIVAAIDDSQQIELAVGNPVRFTIEAGASWTVTAEPGIDGMIVRAERPALTSELEIELDDTPGSFSVDDGFDDAFEADFVLGGSSPARGSKGPPSQLDVEALDAPTLQDPEPALDRSRSSSGSAPAAPFESGTWTLADEDDFDMGLDETDDDRLPSGFSEPPPPSYESRNIGVPDDDEDEPDRFEPERFDPLRFKAEPLPPAREPVAPPREPPQARSPVLSPTLPAVGAAKAAKRPSIAETPTRKEMSAAPRAMAATRRELPVLERPEADTQRELPSAGRGANGLGQLAMSIDAGTLVYVREPGFADALAQSFAAPSVTIDDQFDPDEVWARVRGLPPGTIVIVRREDPSTMLGWILRRLEEGFRVLVETRARTVEGARRILLGVGATDRAEQWLDSQPTLVVEPGEGGPQLRQAG